MAWLKPAAATHVGSFVVSLLVSFAIFCFAGLCGPGAGQAQDVNFPSRPIRIIVPAAPGGVSDLLARGIAQALAKSWNAQVVVENRGGASNQLAAEVVLKSAPDGYTLLLTAEATLVINQWLYKNLSYDPFKDFTPISGLVEISQGLVVRTGLGVNSVAELIALAKAKPDSVTFGNFGVGSTGQLNMVTLQQMTGASFVAVPYKGAAPAMNDILGNHLDAMFISASTAAKFAKGGKVKLLGFGGKKRFAAYPDVPTVAETVPGFVARSWFGLVGPAGMPQPVVQKLNNAIVKVFDDPEFQDRLIKPNLYTPIVSSPQEFSDFIKEDAQVWKKVVEAAKIKID
jgi:tripartite-type tricarboxylate transporter receptor subunit TctC